jgi:hypothetical protein
MKITKIGTQNGDDLWLASLNANEASALAQLALLGATLPEEQQFMHSWEYDFLLEIAFAVGMATLEAEVQERIGGGS